MFVFWVFCQCFGCQLFESASVAILQQFQTVVCALPVWTHLPPPLGQPASPALPLSPTVAREGGVGNDEPSAPTTPGGNAQLPTPLGLPATTAGPTSLRVRRWRETLQLEVRLSYTFKLLFCAPDPQQFQSVVCPPTPRPV